MLQTNPKSGPRQTSDLWSVPAFGRDPRSAEGHATYRGRHATEIHFRLIPTSGGIVNPTSFPGKRESGGTRVANKKVNALLKRPPLSFRLVRCRRKPRIRQAGAFQPGLPIFTQQESAMTALLPSPSREEETGFSLPCPPEADLPMAEWEGTKGRVNGEVLPSVPPFTLCLALSRKGKGKPTHG